MPDFNNFLSPEGYANNTLTPDDLLRTSELTDELKTRAAAFNDSVKSPVDAAAIRRICRDGYFQLVTIYDILDDLSAIGTYGMDEQNAQLVRCPDISVKTFDASIFFCEASKDDIIGVLKMPRPIRRESNCSNYHFKWELSQALCPDCTELSASLRSGAGACFVFSSNKTDQPCLDHDNYYIKPIIDSIAATLRIPDTGTGFMQQYITLKNGKFEDGFFVILFPQKFFGLRLSEALKILKHFDNFGR